VELFEHYNQINADALQDEWDVIIVHDPQPVMIHRMAPEHAKKWVWRCHIDLSEPNPAPIEKLLPYIAEYDATVWHTQQYVPNGLEGNVNLIRRRSTRCRRRTWRSAPTTRASSAISSASTSTGR